MKKIVSRISPLMGLTIVMMMILGFIAFSSIAEQLQTNSIREIAIQANQTATNTNSLAGKIAEVIFSQNRTNLILGGFDQVQNNLSEFIMQSEENRQKLVRVLVPALQESFNQTNNIEKAVQNLTQVLKFGVDRQDILIQRHGELIQKLDTTINLLNKTS